MYFCIYFCITCSLGKPAHCTDEKHPDWCPTINMGINGNSCNQSFHALK